MMPAVSVVIALSLSAPAQIPGVVDSWQVPMWADHDFSGTDGSVRVVQPGSRIDLMSIACEEDPASAESGEGPAFQCFPARLRLPKGGDAYSFTGTSDDAHEDMLRLQRCFDVRLVKAPDAIVKQAADQSLGTVPPPAELKQQKAPVAVLVAYATMVNGWQRTFEFSWMMPSENGEVWANLPMPYKHPQEDITIAIVEAPGAKGIAQAIRAKDYRGGLKRAKAALRSAKAGALDDTVMGALHANVAAAAILAGAKRDVIAEGAFDDGKADGGDVFTLQLARRWAKGEVWLGPDPCAR